MPNDINFKGQEVDVEENDDQDVNLLADILDDEEPNESSASVKQEDYNALKTQVEDLTKANAGLLQAKQAETRKRQESMERLNQLEGAVGTILSQRQQQGMESVSESQAADARGMGIPVTYDDDGNGWIDPNYIKEMVSPYEQEINDLKAQLQQTSATTSAISEAEKVRQSIIGEDERFGPASGRYRAARKWVEDQVADYARSNGRSDVSSGEALDRAFDQFAMQEFQKNFPGLSLMDIVTAEDSQMHFRNTLNNIANALEVNLQSPKEKMDSKFQKVLNKPSNLGNAQNAQAGQLSIVEQVAGMSTDAIMDLSDDKIDALLKLVEKG